MANRVPEIVQFGSGPLSVIDPTQAPPGKHTTYAWHVMPLAPDIGAKDYETFKQEFAERIIEKWAKYAPNMTRKNIIAQHVYTAQRIHADFPEMRGGDIFMGVVQRRAGDVQPLRLPHAGRAALHGGLGLPSRRRDLRRRRLHQRRHHRARSRAEAVVEAVGRRRGAARRCSTPQAHSCSGERSEDGRDPGLRPSFRRGIRPLLWIGRRGTESALSRASSLALLFSRQ